MIPKATILFTTLAFVACQKSQEEKAPDETPPEPAAAPTNPQPVAQPAGNSAQSGQTQQEARVTEEDESDATDTVDAPVPGLHADPAQAAVCAAATAYHTEDELKLTQGRIVSIGPKTRPIGTERILAPNARGFDALTTYFGIDLDLPCVFFFSRLGSATPYAGLPVGSNSTGWIGSGIYYSLTTESENPASYTEDDGKSTGDVHEMTHAIMWNAPLTRFLQEGLATYMQDTGRSGYMTSYSDNLRCGEAGFEVFAGAGSWTSYVYADYIGNAAPSILHYYSASCFWSWLDSTIGHDSFTAVMTQMDARRGEDFYSFYEILRNVLGDTTAELARARWSLPSR